MQKIPTMFVRDESAKGHPVTPIIKPECQWVLDGEGVATAKIDGTNVKVEKGVLYKRQKPASGDYDEASYVPCVRADPADKWAWEAFDAAPVEDGIYELVGPKIQGNKHGYVHHRLVGVVPPSSELSVQPITDRSYAALRGILETSQFEGFVFHHPDGRMAKIKRRDFGFRW